MVTQKKEEPKIDFIKQGLLDLVKKGTEKRLNSPDPKKIAFGKELYKTSKKTPK